eukprot:3388206-Prymnesium_polylepis.1
MSSPLALQYAAPSGIASGVATRPSDHESCHDNSSGARLRSADPDDRELRREDAAERTRERRGLW